MECILCVAFHHVFYVFCLFYLNIRIHYANLRVFIVVQFVQHFDNDLAAEKRKEKTKTNKMKRMKRKRKHYTQQLKRKMNGWMPGNGNESEGKRKWNIDIQWFGCCYITLYGHQFIFLIFTCCEPLFCYGRYLKFACNILCPI